MTEQILRIATRKSPLALWQAEFVRGRLQDIHKELDVSLVPMSTHGDKILDTPLALVGGKALFVKELEQALLEDRADIAVHSSKDVPVDFPEGLELAVILERDDPRDALVSRQYASLEELPSKARLGTSSVRRQCQLLKFNPELEIADLRGNVGTRLGKLDDGEFDAILLACAGLDRMGLAERITQRLEPELILPAIAQGAMGIECRADDSRIKKLIAPLDHQESHTRVRAERALNQGLMGGCQVPVAGYAEIQGQELWLRGMVGSPDGANQVYGDCRGLSSEAEQLGAALAIDLLSRGADEILKKYFGTS